MEQEEENLLLKYVSGDIPFSQWLQSEHLDSDSDDEEDETDSGKQRLTTIDAETFSKEFTADLQFQDKQSILTSLREDDIPLPVVTAVTSAPTSTHSRETLASTSRQYSSTETTGIASSPLASKSPIQDTADTAEESDSAAIGAISQQLSPKKRRQKRKRKRKYDLPEILRGHMGEANLCVARGDITKAKDICMEIIRQAPHCKEPFQTLGHICEDNDDTERALQLYLIAAHLGPGDVDEWIKLAELSLEQENIQQSIMCFSKAIKLEPTHLHALWSRAQLYEQEKEMKKAMESYELVLKALPDDCGEKYFTVATLMAKNYHECSDIESAVFVLERACDKHPQYISSEAVNILGDLYMAMHDFMKALDFICSTCGVSREFLSPPSKSSGSLGNLAELVRLSVEDTFDEASQTTSSDTESRDVIEKWNVPPDLPIDLRSKIIVCLIHVHKFTLIQDVITPMLHESPEDCGDLYLDIAEAYAENGCFEQALPILTMLVNTKKYDQAEVWLKRAECLNSLGNYDESARSYARVVTLAPHHVQARLTLAALYQQLGQPDEALQVLTQTIDSEDLLGEDKSLEGTVDTAKSKSPQKQTQAVIIPDLSQEDLQLTYHRCSLLYSQTRHDEFVANGHQVLSYYFRDTFCKSSQDLDDYAITKQKRARIRKIKEGAGDNDEENQRLAVPASVIDEVCDALTEDEWWDLFKKVTLSLGHLKRYKDAEHLIKVAISSNKFCENPDHEKEMNIMCCSAAVLSGNISLAYEIGRMMLTDYLSHSAFWNLFNRVLIQTRDIRHHRYCMRLMHKYPDCLPLIIVNGNNAFVTGTYKYALTEYNRAFRMTPDDPFITLFTAIVYIHLASQKFPQRRHSHMVEAFIFFFQYMSLRGKCQEVYYNIGRAFHQVGLFHFAVYYYNKALQFPFDNPTVNLKLFSIKQLKHDRTRNLGLHREAAFNLSLIYRESGNEILARDILAKYCRI